MAWIIVCLRPMTNQADTNSDSYGDVCSPDNNNDGIREIQTVAQLSAVRNNLGARYELVTDIDLNSTNWTPIGERFQWCVRRQWVYHL